MAILQSALLSGRPVAQAEASRSLPASLPTTIEVARVVLVIGLVFLHYFSFPNSRVSPFTGFDPDQHSFATFVNSFILLFFFSAVPLLSTISGWLFFGLTDHPLQTIARRMRGRIVSLLLPLITWSLATIATGFVLHAIAPTTGLLGEFRFDFDEPSLFGLLDGIFGLTGLPTAFQFWFVRDLFLSVLVSPLLWLILRHAPLAGVAVLGASWVCDFTFGIFIRTDVLFFFFLGGFARMRQVPLNISWSTTKVLLVSYALLMAARALAPLWLDPTTPPHEDMLDLATRLARPLGVVACWGLCLRLATTQLGGFFARYGGFAFFLHASHFPIIIFVKYLLWSLVPAETDTWMLAHYAASVAVTVSVAALGAAVIFRLSPSLYAFLAGGRRFV
ncbi:acyltransferase family protein [Belnapia sp. T18]|uniref:Acyltransferase family protein n=1 Tax=Belnapia arida TaxID=2804533 RepID=A0ABS1U4B9_9PROT|nr:acyltransferase family protein [Belnapia arida]MBL6079503.1 acyltransferase family protein [Belnapia arida]